MPMKQKTKADLKLGGSPVAWFVVLEHARRTQDFETAARARRALAALGVRVTYTRRRRGVSDE